MKMKISDLHPVERPRERLLRVGPQGLSEEELLALVLRTGYAGRCALEVAREALKAHPAGALGRLPLKELAAFKGVGLSRAGALAAALELARRWSGEAEEGLRLDSPERAAAELSFLRDKRKEHFVAFYLNACHQVLHRETVSVGTLTASLVHPREVFAPAVERGAAAVLVAHNHPSGNPEPSPEDREATRRLSQAGRILGIPVVDHLIVGRGRYVSLRERGLL